MTTQAKKEGGNPIEKFFSGLQGVLFSPFIHADIQHVYNNSVPLLILVAALRFFYSKQSLAVMGFGILFSGFITWLIGRPSYHIGASGFIYVLVSFIFFKGIQTQYYRLVALSLAVVVVYGGLVWYIFPNIEEGISWEGHLGGLVTGLAIASIYAATRRQNQKFAQFLGVVLVVAALVAITLWRIQEWI